MQVNSTQQLPLVYACSGCEGGAQMAHNLALRLDREQIARMMCIVGLAAHVPSQVAIASSGRPIIALDGCKERCVLQCLARCGVKPTLHYDLTPVAAAGCAGRNIEVQDARRVIADLYDALFAGRPDSSAWQTLAHAGLAEE